MSADAAPMSWAGTVLSQPPTSTAASSGWARSISSTSMLIRLRRNMLVGLRKTSPSETVGNAIGKAPPASTPRLTASTSSGTWRWQLLRSLGLEQMPTTGRSSIASDRPIDLAKDLRR